MLINRAFDRYEELVRGLTPDRFDSIRLVGRNKLQTTAVSLAIHIAEHGQRHVGQLISAAKLAATDKIGVPYEQPDGPPPV